MVISFARHELYWTFMGHDGTPQASAATRSQRQVTDTLKLCVGRDSIGCHSTSDEINAQPTVLEQVEGLFQVRGDLHVRCKHVRVTSETSQF